MYATRSNARHEDHARQRDAAVPTAPLLAVAAHLQPRTAGSRIPWGTVHARHEGIDRTSCGLPCRQWHTLWERPVDAASPSMCQACVSAIDDAARLSDGLY